MKLSIIIVNYNVRYFLEQTLKSIYSSDCPYAYEVFVVDNASVDDSLAMVEERFPEVIVCAMDTNLGFSKANNYAIEQAHGDYILLLNPDTILREDSLRKSIEYMDENDNCGGLGIRMIDGSGTYLEESKRGIPTPLTSFFKLMGITSLFPHSRFFNAYYLGHLSPEESSQVEILAGAYMMLRKSVLDEIGYLDEDFFMYGEDIDLSYRILKAGYHNYYLADSEIIHFKGESTRKATFNYVKLFHKAMIQFARKHFNKLGGVYIMFLHIGIYMKAITTLVTRWISRFLMPIMDFFLLWGMGIGVVKLWERVYYGIENFYTKTFTTGILPLSILVMIGIMYLFGVYDKPIRLRKLLSGLLFAALGVLAFYGLLGEDLRSSRAVISLLAVLSFFVLPLIRAGVNAVNYGQFAVEFKDKLRYIIVGKQEMVQPIQEILDRQNRIHSYVGRVEKTGNSGGTLGRTSDLSSIVRAHGVNEIFFCTGDVSRTEIMRVMTELGTEARYRIVEGYDFNILASDSKDVQGKLYTRKVKYNINAPDQQRVKRIFDFLSAVIFFVLSPILIMFYKRKGNYMRNVFQVLLGKKTWVSYTHDSSDLPQLKPGIFNTEDVYENSIISESTIADELYAREYTLGLDFTTFFRHVSVLDKEDI